ncbi:uncharacterized protein LOC114525714 [Dendronephthya gigantea]|uniref:uncharacterized protein LOC114525714 n=1 Tax=Dendronephthya gigantea TaxID=151771 RepID=UPI00106BFEC1|nr:uncharacterized protein LOC114525714 [Dendronephthya gigantea]
MEGAKQEEKPVVCFLQPDFIQQVKGQEKPLFDVTVLDDASVFHVRVRGCADKAKPECTQNGDDCCEKDACKSSKVYLKVLGSEESLDDGEKIKAGLPEIFDKKETGKPELLLIIGEKLNKKKEKEDGIKVFLRSKRFPEPMECDVLLQPSKELLYSRSKGILESGLLEKRKVAIVGLGSGGSFIAVELAKAGVGHFILIDFDRIELNNIARHVCGLEDLGRLKTNAVRDILHNKNPFITIETHCSNINRVHEARKILKDCDLIVAATDNVRSRLNINSIAIEHNIPTLFGKCSVRAAGGEVLRVRPNDGPCFSCVFTNQSLEASQEEVSSFRQAREANPTYVSDDDVDATIQVGLSSDIIPIGNMLVKLALVELCRGEDSALATLEKDLVAPYYRWANRREQEFESYPEGGFSMFNQPSVLRWYAVDFERKSDCTACRPLPQISEEEAAFFGS